MTKQLHSLFFTFMLLVQLCWAQESNEMWMWSEDHREQWQTMFQQVENLKRRHSLDPIQGIEVLIAEPTDARIQSQFGHAMIRFVNAQSQDNPASDLVLNFVAYVHTPRLSARGGLAGEYAIIPEVMTLSQALTKYLQTEGRPLRRVVIPTSAQMRQDLLDHLFQWWHELEMARPQFLAQAKAQAKSLALQKARAQNPQGDFIPVTIRSPQGGDLGVAILDHADFPHLGAAQWQELKLLDEHHEKLQELLNLRAYQQTFQKALELVGPDQWLIKIGPHLAMLQELNDYVVFPLPQNQQHYQQLIKEATLELRQRGHRITSIRDLSVAQLFTGDQRSQEELIIFPYQSWQLAVLSGKVESIMISPEFEAIKPPRMSVEQLGRYTFLGQNCASALIRYFEAAQLPARPGRTVARRIPTKLSEFLNESLLAPYPELKVERLALIKDQLVRILGTEDFYKFQFTEFTQNQLVQLTQLFEKHPVAALFYLIPELNDKDRAYFLILNRPEENSFASIHGLQQLSPLLYDVCESRSCAQTLLRELEDQFGKKSLEEAKKQMQLNTRQQISPRDYSRIDRRRNITPAPVYYKRAEVIKHLDLLDFLNPRFPRAL